MAILGIKEINKEFLIFPLSLFLLAFSLAIMFFGKYKERPTILLEIDEKLLTYYSFIDEIKKTLEKYLNANVVTKEIKESSDKPFSYSDIKPTNKVKIVLTSRRFSEDLEKHMPYKPFGIAVEPYSAIIISLSTMLSKLKEVGYDEGGKKKIFQRLVLHELYHLTGGKDNIYDKGIANPHLCYDPSKGQLKFIREGLYRLEKELYEKS